MWFLIKEEEKMFSFKNPNVTQDIIDSWKKGNNKNGKNLAKYTSSWFVVNLFSTPGKAKGFLINTAVTN